MKTAGEQVFGPAPREDTGPVSRIEDRARLGKVLTGLWIGVISVALAGALVMLFGYLS